MLGILKGNTQNLKRSVKGKKLCSLALVVARKMSVLERLKVVYKF